jgi:hypothetical protein
MIAPVADVERDYPLAKVLGDVNDKVLGVHSEGESATGPIYFTTAIWCLGGKKESGFPY